MENLALLKVPSLFNIPPEILQNILDYISKRDIFCLYLTCHGLKESPTILRALYTEIFDRDDLPLGTYEEYIVNHRPIFNTLLRGLTVNTGAFVRHVAVHEWFTETDISLLLKYCPNLESADFTGISEGIDWTRLTTFQRADLSSSCYCLSINSGMDSCPATQAQFEWHGILDIRPMFFRKLKTIELTLQNSQNSFRRNLPNIENARREVAYRQLPRLLRLASSLQSLRLQYSPCQSGAARSQVDQWLLGFANSKILQENILEHASENLTTLELRAFRIMIPNLRAFLAPLQSLPNLNTIVLSVHHDMMLHTLDWQFVYQSCLPIRAPQALIAQTRQLRMRNSTVRYVERLKSIFESQRWNLVCADNGSRYPMGPRAFYGFLDERKLELLGWIRANLNWTPVFLWSEYVCAHDSLLVEHRASLDEELILCRKFFEALKGMEIPIKLIIPPFHDGAIFCPVPGLKTLNGLRAPGYNEITQNLSNWRLDKIGDLVDELSLRWGYAFGYLCRYPTNERETVEEHIARTEQLLKAHLERELHKFQQFCKTLATNFPNIARLALFIPAAIYPHHPDRNNDADFINHLLPGTGWRVQHHGSGGGMPYDTLDVRHEFGVRHLMRYPFHSNCSSHPLPHPFGGDRAQKSWETWLRSQTRCPFIHRVFTRELPAGQSAANKECFFREWEI